MLRNQAMQKNRNAEMCIFLKLVPGSYIKNKTTGNYKFALNEEILPSTPIGNNVRILQLSKIWTSEVLKGQARL